MTTRSHGKGLRASSLITGVSALSCLGLEGSRAGEFSRPIESLQSGNAHSKLTKQHRFAHQFSGPLGEIAWDELDASDPTDNLVSSDLTTLERSDAVYLRGLAALCRDLLKRSPDFFDRHPPESIGFVLGATTFGIGASFERRAALASEFNHEALPWLMHENQQNDRLLAEVRRLLPIRGFMTTVSTACSSGTLALGLAHDLIASGALSAVVAGGFDVLNPITIQGFSALQLLSQDVSEPFSRSSGMNLGEGGALLTLEAGSALSRDSAMAEVLAYSLYNEGYHPTQPHPDGLGMAECMRRALAQADIAAGELGEINAHGSGTQANDLAEQAAMNLLLQGEGRSAGRPNIQATKRLHGHALGGAGALELALSLMQRDPPAKAEVIMKNSFGFGGSNVSLIVRRLG